MPYKIRVHKKKESIPLRLVSRSEEMLDQVRSHPKWVWGGIGVLVALTSIFMTFWFLNHRAEEKASVLESEAFRLFHEPPPLPEPKEDIEGTEFPKEMDKTERLKKSASLYQEIMEKYPRSARAPIALYESGHIYFELREYDLAEKQYRTFLHMYPDRKNLVSLVHLRMGYLNQIKGESESALEHFRSAYEMQGAKSRDQAGFELARLLEEADRKSEAVEIYKKVSEDFSLSPWGAEAKARFEILTPPSASAPSPPPPEDEPPTESELR
jgi:tetratricopeptide (TPR) repeat protein